MSFPPIAAFTGTSMIEWEDRTSAVIVLQGCNFRCGFCHSSPMVPVGVPEDEVPWNFIEDKLRYNRDWIDGVVVSGGEPCIHASLKDLLVAIKRLRLPLKLDTNGSNPKMLRELVEAGLVQHVALDIKTALNTEDYKNACGGVDMLDNVKASLEFLLTDAVSYELRTTTVPGITDEPQLLEIANSIPKAKHWYLQGFRPMHCLEPAFENLTPTHPDWLEAMAENCRKIVPSCEIRGAL